MLLSAAVMPPICRHPANASTAANAQLSRLCKQPAKTAGLCCSNGLAAMHGARRRGGLYERGAGSVAECGLTA